MMINNINPFVNKSDWLKNLEQKLGFLNLQIRLRGLKTLGTSAINSPLSNSP